MADYDLDRLLVQVRRIEEHREKGVEKEIRKAYQELLKELRHYLADTYTQYAEDDLLSYAILQRHSAYARFLEEVEQRINDISPDVKRLIRSTVDQTYEYTYNGMMDCVKKAVTDPAAVGVLKACTPDIIRRAVENPVSKLTLNDRLEKHRKEIVYNIKQDISVGLMNGDRYSTMANRVKKSVDDDYKKAIRIARTETHRVREAGNQDAALSVNEALKGSTAGIQMMKTWRTMKDERVRPSHRYKTRKGWKTGKPGKYDHKKMDGVTIPVDEEFTLPSGARTLAPGQSGVAGEDINCRCYLSYKLQKVEHGLAAGNSHYSIPEHPEPQELETIDSADRKLIQSKLEQYERQIVSEPVENAIVITREGQIFRCIGTESQVFPNTDLGEALRGSYVTHNHPIGQTHFSFSADDLAMFMEYQLPELRGADSKYSYRLVRLPGTENLDRDTVAHLFSGDYYHKTMEKAFMGEIDMEEDEYHEIVKLFAKKCGFRYERRQT